MSRDWFEYTLGRRHEEGTADADIYDVLRRTVRCDLGVAANGPDDEMAAGAIRAAKDGRITLRDTSGYKTSWERMAEKLSEMSGGK